MELQHQIALERIILLILQQKQRGAFQIGFKKSE